MSFTVLSILQYAGIFLGYFAVMILIGSMLFYRYLKGKGLVFRYVFCFTVSNLYLINMVLALGLIKISNRPLCLFLILALPVWRFLMTVGIDYKSVFKNEGLRIEKLLHRQLGVRSYVTEKLAFLLKWLSRGVLAVLRHLGRHWLEWLLFIAITGFNVYYFSYQVFHYYGYGASDTVVHLQWVELIAEGKLFAAGVYPHGFHCVVYFLYQLFRFDLFTIMRFMGPIQAVYVATMIYTFSKHLCRNKYAAFIPYIAFSVFQIFNTESMMRFQMTIPQEYAMLFLFPMLMYLSMFMKRRKAELAIEKDKALTDKAKGCYVGKKEKRKARRALENEALSDEKSALKRFVRRAALRIRPLLKSLLMKLWRIVWPKRGDAFIKSESTRYLLLGAACFSLTLAVHFYITIAAGLFCAAFAIAYFPRDLFRGYFLRLAAAVMAAVFVAIAPMAAGVALGNKIEGSLRWALSIITVGSSATGKISSSEGKETVADEIESSPVTQSADEAQNTDDSALSDSSLAELEAGSETTASAKSAKKSMSIKEKLADSYSKFVPSVVDAFWFSVFAVLVIFCLIVAAFRFIFVRDRQNERDWLCVAFCCLFLYVLFNSSTFGLPELMDKIRARVICAYTLPLLFAYPVDIFFRIAGFPFKRLRGTKHIINALSAAVCCAAIFCSYYFGHLKQISYSYYLQHNGAIMCLNDFVRQYPDEKWTIVSPVDETRMVWKHGYHYELITFLLEQEDYQPGKQSITIPTQYVFIYLEKRVLRYSSVQKSDKPLPDNLKTPSEELASKKLVKYSSASRSYQDNDRPILMSRLYYWVQAFGEKYPDELSVYYEDDEFVCYKIEQNEYHLYNFAIDYGYNTGANKDK